MTQRQDTRDSTEPRGVVNKKGFYFCRSCWVSEKSEELPTSSFKYPVPVYTVDPVLGNCCEICKKDEKLFEKSNRVVISK